MGALEEFNRIVQEECEAEEKLEGDTDDNASLSGQSIHDLTTEDCEDYEGSDQRPVTPLRILVAWRTLLKTLTERDVFLEYLTSLRAGFETCLDSFANMNSDNGVAEDDEMDPENYTHIETLITLLIHTAQNAGYDDSTECRFVTLLEVLQSYGPKWQPSEDVSRLWIRLMQRIPYQCAPLNFRRKAYRVLVSLSWVPSSKGLLAACSIPERKQALVTPLPVASHNFRSAPTFVLFSATATTATSASSEDESDEDGPIRIVPRHDCVNQLLDRLKDETDVCVAITSSRPGMGKSTLAYLVVSHPSIQEHFLVVWIKLKSSSLAPHDGGDNNNNSSRSIGQGGSGSSGMSYDDYREYITQLQDQIREQQNLDDDSGRDDENEKEPEMNIEFPVCEPRFEELAIRQLRQQKAMDETKRRVSKSMEEMGNPNLLLVLENVTDPAQIPLFRFHDHQSIIITTTTHSSSSSSSGGGGAPRRDSNSNEEWLQRDVDWQVVVDPPSSSEAMDLFLGQAGLPSWHLIGTTPELNDLLKNECQYHPLIIRTVARWCRLKAVNTGHLLATISVLDELQELKSNQSVGSLNGSLTFDIVPSAGNGIHRSNSGTIEPRGDSQITKFLFDVISLMMGPSRKDGRGVSAIFVLCLAAMAVVFPERVPLDMVLLLWEQILLVEPFAASEVVEQKTMGLTPKEARQQHVGLIAEGLLLMGMIEIYEVDNCSWIEFHHSLYAQFALLMAKQLDMGNSFQHTVQQWHKAFVTSYFEQRIQGDIDAGGKNSLEYAVRCLPTHIFQANMLKMAETLLIDAKFFETRVDALDWERAVEVHIQDCMRLQNGLDEEHGSSDEVIKVSPVFAKTSAMISSFASKKRIKKEGADGNGGAAVGVGAGSTREEILLNVSTALYRMAFALAEHGYFEEALAQFDAARQTVSSTHDIMATILYGTGWVLLISGDSKRALRKIAKLSKEMDKKHELYKEIRQLHVDLLYERCDYRKALKYIDELEAELMKDREHNHIELGCVLRKKGGVLQIMGKNKEAIDAYSKAIEWKTEAGEMSYGMASCYCQLGDINMELHSPSVAKENFDHAISALADAQCDPEHVNHLLATGKGRFLISDFSGCFDSFRLAREAISVSPLYLLDQSAYDLRCIARAHSARGDLDESIALLKESLELTTHRPKSLERSAALFDFGKCLLECDQVEESLECLKEALSIRVLSLGQVIELFDLLHTIGEVHLMLEEYDESLETYGKAESILKTAAPDDTERAALVAFAVGEVNEDRGDSEGALAAYQKSIEILQMTHASDDAGIAKGNQCMGQVLASVGRFEEARPRFEEAARISERNFNETVLTECQFALGIVLRKLGDYNGAERSLADCLAIRKKQDGAPEYVETLFELANVQRLNSRPFKALALYEECIDKLELDDLLRGDVYQAMGHVRFFEKKADDALLFYHHAHEIRQSHYGKEHIKTASSLRCVGLTQLLFSDIEESEKTLDALLRLCAQLAQTPGPEQGIAVGDHALAAIFLGDARLVRKQKLEASSLWSKAKTIYEQAVADEIPVHRKVQEMYELRLAAFNEGRSVSFDHEEALSLATIMYVDD